MSKIPVRRDELRRKLQAFTGWLNSNGAEICQPTNMYEVLRYRAYWGASRRAMTHIIYAKENGLLTWTGGSMSHYRAFLDGTHMEQAAPPPKAVIDAEWDEQPVEFAMSDKHRKLMKRDGSDCWFCGKDMLGDVTIEHLVPKSRGGGNDMANLVLAHAKCNQKAANLSISEKVEMRFAARAAISLAGEGAGRG